MPRFRLPMLAAVALLAACTTGENFRQVEPGQTRAQVESILGRPDGYERRENQEMLTYANRLMSGGSYDRADYHVLLVDGAVARYGAGAIRQGRAPVSTMLFLPLPR